MAKRYVERIVKLDKNHLTSANGESVEYEGNTGIYENAIVSHSRPSAYRIGNWDNHVEFLMKNIAHNLNFLLGGGGWKLNEPEIIDGRPITHISFADERFDPLGPIEKAMVRDLFDAIDLCIHADRAVKSGNVAVAAGFAYALGRAVERCAVRLKEKQAEKGNRRDRQSLANVAKMKAKAEALRQTRREAVKAEIDRQLRDGQRVVYTDACRRVAESEGVDLRTVTNSVPNEWTRRRRKT